MSDLRDDLSRVEAAYRRAASTGGLRSEDVLESEFAAEGLGAEWTAPDRPSRELLFASWRNGADPDEAMRFLRFALRARSRDRADKPPSVRELWPGVWRSLRRAAGRD